MKSSSISNLDNGMSDFDQSQPSETNPVDTTRTDQPEFWNQIIAQAQAYGPSEQVYNPLLAGFSNSSHGSSLAVQEAVSFPPEDTNLCQMMTLPSGSQSPYGLQGVHAVYGGFSSAGYDTGAIEFSDQSLAAVSYFQS